MEDSIIVSQLEIRAHVGVPVAERREAQHLTLCLRLIPENGLAGLDDDLANTIDYAEVCAAIRDEAEAKPRQLIETLAGDIAAMLLSRYPLSAAEVEIRKYILPGTEYVAVRILRERGE